MFSQTVEYALRAMAYIASREGTGATSTTDEIAAATKTPKAYLSKVLQNLSRAGLVTTQRGLGGGVALSRKSDQVTILDVVNAVDPIRRITTCPLELKSHGSNLCPLHRRLDQALAMVENAFRSTTLAEILAEPSSSVPLCESLNLHDALKTASESSD